MMEYKNCLECRFVIIEKGYEKHAKCSNPKCQKQNLVTGTFENNFCEIARLFDIFCDRKGKYFEPKIKEKEN